jgi:hypothetical protein
VRYVALQSFTDPFDGDWIEKGRTFVSHEADVFRRFPERFETARRSGLDGAITRVEGTVALVDRPRRRPPERSASTSPSRPYWMLGERETWRL